MKSILIFTLMSYLSCYSEINKDTCILYQEGFYDEVMTFISKYEGSDRLTNIPENERYLLSCHEIFKKDSISIFVFYITSSHPTHYLCTLNEGKLIFISDYSNNGICRYGLTLSKNMEYDLESQIQLMTCLADFMWIKANEHEVYPIEKN